MIYKNNNASTITLYGEAADDFLRSVGVELYEEHVVIGENTFLGADGEAILNENGIFLYEDHIILEGQEADAYRARKAKEENENNPLNDKHNRRFTAKYGNFPSDKYFNSPEYKKVEKEISNRFDKVLDGGDTKNYTNAIKYSTHAALALERKNRRRPPKQYKENTIFESIELI